MTAAALARRAVLAVTGPADLLARFAADRDPEAFAGLVRQFGPLVLGTCRRVLGPGADADDAFQAVFVALARNAGRFRDAQALPAWLHRVALRTSRKLLARRKASAALGEPIDPADPFAEVAWKDVRRVLDEELDRLPEQVRGPVVLCWLDGLTQDEAAGRLGVSLNTVKRRLDAGRGLLRSRLLRRGVAPVVAAVALDGAGLRAAVSPKLVTAVVVAARTAAPAVGLRWVAVLAAGVLAVAAGVAAVGRPQDQPAKEPPAKPPAVVERAELMPHPDPLGDALPAGALLRIGTHRFRDGGSTNQAAVSPDGKVIATASEAGFTFFELATGRRLLHLPEVGVPNGFSPNWSRFGFSPDGTKLYTVIGFGSIGEQGKPVGTVGAVEVFDAATGRHTGTFKAPALPPKEGKPRGQGYGSLWVPKAGDHLVAVLGDEFTVLLDRETGKEAARFPFVANGAIPSPDGLRLFDVANDRALVTVYDGAGKQVHVLEHTAQVATLGYDPAGVVVAAATKPGDVRVWELATGKVLANVVVPVTDPNWGVTALAVTPDRKTLIAGTYRGAVHRFDLAAGKELDRLPNHGGSVNGLFFTDNGKTLVSAGWGHQVQRCDLATGKELPGPAGYDRSLALARSPDGRRIAAADGTGRVELLDGRTGERVREVQPAGKPPAGYATFSPDGATLATAHADGGLRLWDVASGRLVREIEYGPVANKDRGMHFRALRFSPDGGRLAASAEPDTKVFDVATGKEVWADGKRTGRIAFTPDGRTALSGGWDDHVHIRDGQTGEVRASVPSGQGTVDDIAISPDGLLAATCHHNGKVCVRNAATGAIIREWDAHSGVAWGVSFGPGGLWLASSGDRTVAIWDVATGTLIRRFEGHAARAYSAHFAPDGRTVLSHSLDLTGYVWRVEPEAEAAGGRTPAELWDDLGGDGPTAFRAVWRAAREPKLLPLLREKLPPAPAADAEKVKAIAGRLGDDDFAVREKAEKELIALGPGAGATARELLGKASSAEVRARLGRVVGRWAVGMPGPDDWRRKRAVVAVGLAGTPDARALLERWAGGVAGVPLTDEARAALGRLGGK